MKAPAMPFYWKDFYGDEAVALLSWAHHGLYVRLLAWQWSEASIPTDIEKIVAVVGRERETRKLWEDVGAFFKPHASLEGRSVNLRLMEHWERQEERRGQRQAGAAKTNANRWGDRTPGSRSERLAVARGKGTHTQDEWTQILMVAGGRCLKCLSVVAHLDKDHIKPLACGGSDDFTNLQPLCPPCNVEKGGDATDYRATFLSRSATRGLSLSDGIRDVLSDPIATLFMIASRGNANAIAIGTGLGSLERGLGETFPPPPMSPPPWDNAPECFAALYAKHPTAAGRFLAEQIFAGAVDSEATFRRVETAHEKYREHLANNIGKQPQNLATWLADWEGWEHHVELERKGRFGAQGFDVNAGISTAGTPPLRLPGDVGFD